jgi:photosystem II stability/assembly factor-like uncharacterized protein
MKKFLLSFSFNLFTCTICFSQWVQTSGPPGGTVTAIATNSQYLFAAVHGDGIYRTEKDTIAWQLVSNGLTNITVNALGVMADRLFAGTSIGVFRSDDNGDNWIDQTNQVNEFVNCFTSDNDEIYAGCQPFVYRSADDGITWSPVASGQFYHYNLLLINNNIYSGCDDFLGSPGWGVRLSTDHGATWTPLNTGLNSYGVRSLAVIQDHFFAGTIGHGVYRSTLSLPTWSPSNTGIDNFTVLQMTVVDSTLIAVTDSGLYSTTDYGNTWNHWAQVLSYLTPISIYHLDSMIFIGTLDGGLFETDKEGIQFISLGFPNALVYSMEANDTVAVCIGNWGEVYRTYNAGSSWQNLGINYPGFSPFTFSLYLNGGDVFLATTSGCFLSEDYGDSWQIRNSGINNDTFCQFIGEGKNALYLASQENLYRSVNNGDSWQILSNPNLPNSFGVIQVAEDDSFLFASTWSGYDYIFRSADLGQTWENISTGPLVNHRVFNIKLSHNRLFVLATDNNVSQTFYSDDEGTTWIPVPMNSGLTTSDAFDLFTKGDSLIVSTVDGKIFVSLDQGISWTDMSDGLPYPTVDGIYDIAINGNYLLATDYYKGVWRRPITEIFTGVPLYSFSIEAPDIFPNPTSDQLNIRLVPSTQFVTLETYDVYGTKLRSLKTRCTAGQQFSFDASHLIAGLPAGLYQIITMDGNKRYPASVIKMLNE